MENLGTITTLIITIIGATGGLEGIKYIINRRNNAKNANSETLQLTTTAKKTLVDNLIDTNNKLSAKLEEYQTKQFGLSDDVKRELHDHVKSDEERLQMMMPVFGIRPGYFNVMIL